MYGEFCGFSGLEKPLVMVNNLGLITGIVNGEKIVIYYMLVIEMQKPTLRLRSTSDPDGGDTKLYIAAYYGR
jgi:hypothetical protein